jgi:AP-1 complex subunit sigma 1/2
MNFNELITLEIIHMFVETLDRYFGNVCELDIMCAAWRRCTHSPHRAFASPCLASEDARVLTGAAWDDRFNFHKAYYLLDELVMGGELQETNKKEVLDIMAQQEDSVVNESALGGKKKGGGDAYSDL